MSPKGRKFVDRVTDYIPGMKFTKSAVKTIYDGGKKLLTGDKTAAVNQLLGLDKNKSLVKKLQQKGINLGDEAQPYISKIAGETHDEMLANTRSMLKPSGKNLNKNIKNSGLEIDLTEIQTEILEEAKKLSVGSASDQRRAKSLIDEAAPFFEKHGDKMDAVEASKLKTMFDDVLYTISDKKKNITPMSAAEIKFKDIFNKYVRKQLKTRGEIKASLKEYEILKAIEKALENVVGSVEGFTPKIPFSLTGTVSKILTEPTKKADFLTKQVTKKTPVRDVLKKVKVPERVKSTGITVGLLGEGGGGINPQEWQDYKKEPYKYK